MLDLINASQAPAQRRIFSFSLPLTDACGRDPLQGNIPHPQSRSARSPLLVVFGGPSERSALRPPDEHVATPAGPAEAAEAGPVDVVVVFLVDDYIQHVVSARKESRAAALAQCHQSESPTVKHLGAVK